MPLNVRHEIIRNCFLTRFQLRILSAPCTFVPLLVVGAPCATTLKTVPALNSSFCFGIFSFCFRFSSLRFRLSSFRNYDNLLASTKGFRFAPRPVRFAIFAAALACFLSMVFGTASPQVTYSGGAPPYSAKLPILRLPLSRAISLVLQYLEV